MISTGVDGFNIIFSFSLVLQLLTKSNYHMIVATGPSEGKLNYHMTVATGPPAGKSNNHMIAATGPPEGKSNYDIITATETSDITGE